MHKYIFSLIAIGLTVFAFFPYIRSILKGKIKPHVFSWIIWGMTTFIAFLAQLKDNGGAGAWPIGISGLITIYVAVIAFINKSDNSITKMDWLFFILAISSIPFWYLTSDPLIAILILTITDLLGFGPTIKKSYYFPFEEKISFFLLFLVRNIISIFALEHYSLTTVLFPGFIAFACFSLILLLLIRRKILNTDES